MNDNINMGEEYKNLSGQGLDAYNKIKKTLSKEQNELFEEFVNLNIDAAGLANEIHFKEGFKAGILLALECLSDN